MVKIIRGNEPQSELRRLNPKMFFDKPFGRFNGSRFELLSGDSIDFGDVTIDNISDKNIRHEIIELKQGEMTTLQSGNVILYCIRSGSCYYNNGFSFPSYDQTPTFKQLSVMINNVSTNVTTLTEENTVDWIDVDIKINIENFQAYTATPELLKRIKDQYDRQYGYNDPKYYGDNKEIKNILLNWFSKKISRNSNQLDYYMNTSLVQPKLRLRYDAASKAYKRKSTMTYSYKINGMIIRMKLQFTLQYNVASKLFEMEITDLSGADGSVIRSYIPQIAVVVVEPFKLDDGNYVSKFILIKQYNFVRRLPQFGMLINCLYQQIINYDEEPCVLELLSWRTTDEFNKKPVITEVGE